MKNGAFHAGHELDYAGSADILDQPVNDLVPEIAVSHLTASETKARLHLVAFGKKADRLILFGLVIVLVDGYRELDFLDGDDFLALAGGALALFLFVEKTAIILNPANGRNGIGRHFNQVKAAFAGYAESLKRLKDAKLFAVLVDDADFTRANSVVDANEGLCRSFIECDGTPPKARRAGRGRAPHWAAEQRRTLSIALARPCEEWG